MTQSFKVALVGFEPMRMHQSDLHYIKGIQNIVADTLSQPILLIEANNEGTWLGKSREEMRNLQREEDR